MKKILALVLGLLIMVAPMAIAEAADGAAEVAEAPAESAEAPAESAEAPAESAEAPAESTEAPAESAEAPAEGTEAPAESAEAPAEGTEAPAESAEEPAEESAEGTEAPAESTEAPAGSTEAPAESAAAPAESAEESAEGFATLRQENLWKEEVKLLQKALKALGYKVGGVDGYFGPRTEKAVKAFQSDNGLEETGEVDEALYNTILNKAANATAEKISMFDFAAQGLKDVVENEGMTYMPAEDGTFTLSGTAAKEGLIFFVPTEFVAREEIPDLPTLFVLEKGQTYLISGIQLLYIKEDSSIATINACTDNRTLLTAMEYIPTEDLAVKEIRVYFAQGNASEGTYEPAVIKLVK